MTNPDTNPNPNTNPDDSAIYTIKEIRRKNLLVMIDVSGLSKSAFADKVKTSPAYISQIFSQKSKRNMGDQFARKIEMSFKKPKGWMDNQHPS